MTSEIHSVRQSTRVGRHEQAVAWHAASHNVLKHLLTLGDRERRTFAARAKESHTIAADVQQVLDMSQYFREINAAVSKGGNKASRPQPLQQLITRRA